MDELGLPKNLREAIPFIIWGVLVLGFGLEFCTALAHEEWLRAGICFLLMCGLAAMALYSNDAKRWFALTNPNYAFPMFMLALLAVILSPFVQERKWPVIPFYQVARSQSEMTVTREAAYSPPTIEPQQKLYFPAEKRELGDLLVNIERALDADAIPISREAHNYGNDLPTSKSGLADLLKRVDATRGRIVTLRNDVWGKIIGQNPRFRSELSQVIGDVDRDSNNVEYLDKSLAKFSRELGILVDHFDSLGDNRAWVEELLRDETENVHSAAENFNGWIQNCDNRIDAKRQLLQ